MHILNKTYTQYAHTQRSYTTYIQKALSLNSMNITDLLFCHGIPNGPLLPQSYSQYCTVMDPQMCCSIHGNIEGPWVTHVKCSLEWSQCQQLAGGGDPGKPFALKSPEIHVHGHLCTLIWWRRSIPGHTVNFSSRSAFFGGRYTLWDKMDLVWNFSPKILGSPYSTTNTYLEVFPLLELNLRAY